MEKVTFGAGCFWHVEEAFSKIKGIIKTTAGYMGGKVKNPTYQQVCADKTGHAEVVQLEFNPEIISYEELLNMFWKIHNPTQLNRQGPDIGNQYRTAIFYHNEKQKKIALKSRERWQKMYNNRIVTEIKKAGNFYKAEEYHQRYFEKNIF